MVISEGCEGDIHRALSFKSLKQWQFRHDKSEGLSYERGYFGGHVCDNLSKMDETYGDVCLFWSL